MRTEGRLVAASAVLCKQDGFAAYVKDHRGRDAVVLMQDGGDQFGALPGFAKVTMPAAALHAFVQLPASGCGDNGEQ